MIKFSDWLLSKESSAFTRLRRAAALGLMPPIPDAAINSRSTAAPWEQEALKGKGKCKKKKKKKKSKNESVDFKEKYWIVEKSISRPRYLEGETPCLYDENGMYVGVKEGFQGYASPSRSSIPSDLNYYKINSIKEGHWERNRLENGKVNPEWVFVYDKKLDEKFHVVKHIEMDGWLGSVDRLKAALEMLKKVMHDKAKEPAKAEEPEKEDKKLDKKAINKETPKEEDEKTSPKKKEVINAPAVEKTQGNKTVKNKPVNKPKANS